MAITIKNYYSLRLIGIVTVVFALQFMFPAITSNFALVSAEVLIHPWTIITHMFLHGGFEHFFYNMFGLFLFGLILFKLPVKSRCAWYVHGTCDLTEYFLVYQDNS